MLKIKTSIIVVLFFLIVLPVYGACVLALDEMGPDDKSITDYETNTDDEDSYVVVQPIDIPSDTDQSYSLTNLELKDIQTMSKLLQVPKEFHSSFLSTNQKNALAKFFGAFLLGKLETINIGSVLAFFPNESQKLIHKMWLTVESYPYEFTKLFDLIKRVPTLSHSQLLTLYLLPYLDISSSNEVATLFLALYPDKFSMCSEKEILASCPLLLPFGSPEFLTGHFAYYLISVDSTIAMEALLQVTYRQTGRNLSHTLNEIIKWDDTQLLDFLHSNSTHGDSDVDLLFDDDLWDLTLKYIMSTRSGLIKPMALYKLSYGVSAEQNQKYQKLYDRALQSGVDLLIQFRKASLSIKNNQDEITSDLVAAFKTISGSPFTQYQVISDPMFGIEIIKTEYTYEKILATLPDEYKDFFSLEYLPYIIYVLLVDYLLN